MCIRDFRTHVTRTHALACVAHIRWVTGGYSNTVRLCRLISTLTLIGRVKLALRTRELDGGLTTLYPCKKKPLVLSPLTKSRN